MIKRLFKLIHDLRIFLFAFIIVTTFYSVGLNPVDFGKYFTTKLTQAVGIGTSTTVSPNPFNTLASQLKQKEERLNKKEADLNAQNFSFGSLSQRSLFFIMIFGIVILFFLILMNFYLDYRNVKKSKKS
jgi:hypothetical protein